MKIQGTSTYRPLDQGKKAGKSEGKGFDKVLDKASRPEKKDSLDLGKTPAANAGYSMNPALKSAKPEGAQIDPIVQKAMETPEQINSRVDEIRKLISEGGVEAYFKSVDSQKVAQKILDSGILDDTI